MYSVLTISSAYLQHFCARDLERSSIRLPMSYDACLRAAFIPCFCLIVLPHFFLGSRLFRRNDSFRYDLSCMRVWADGPISRISCIFMPETWNVRRVRISHIIPYNACPPYLARAPRYYLSFSRGIPFSFSRLTRTTSGHLVFAIAISRVPLPSIDDSFQFSHVVV